jgi:hypothetical protein
MYNFIMRFWVNTMLHVKITVLPKVVASSLVDLYERFGKTCSFQLRLPSRSYNTSTQVSSTFFSFIFLRFKYVCNYYCGIG